MNEEIGGANPVDKRNHENAIPTPPGRSRPEPRGHGTTRLTPVEIDRRTFNRSFRGYEVEEVEEFLSQVLRDYEALYRENLEHKEKIELLHEQLDRYHAMEENLQRALLMAQNTAEDLVAQKEREAALIIREAQLGAEKAQAQLDEKYRKASEEYEQLKCRKERFLIELRTLLQTHLDSLDEGRRGETQP